MKLIAFTIFCLVITETITGIPDSEKHPDSAAGKNADGHKNSTQIKVPEFDSVEPLNPNATSTSTTTTTVAPNTTTTTTTSAPTTKSTTSSTPLTTPITSSTTPTPPTVPPTDSPAHKADRKFDSFSFIAGIVMAAGSMAIGLVALKFYEARRDRNYHTI